MHRSLLIWIVASLLLGGLIAATPAEACGCGAYIPREGTSTVPQERALIRWDGQTEDIIMALTVEGAATDAAWILPVPSRATVQLADPALFDELAELTRPRIETRYVGEGTAGSAPIGAARVTVLDRQTLGPFDVANLAATDAGALETWLQSNGYRFAPRLRTALEPYVAQGWEYVAVKLTPGAGATTISGELDPLWVTFQSAELVYPMRLSALARGDLAVFLYVLAAHRVEPRERFGYQNLVYADWIDPADLPAASTLRPFVPQRMFLTKYRELIYDPAQITDDYHFGQAADNSPFRDVEYRYVTLPTSLPLLGLALACAIGFGGLLLLGLGALIRRRPRRRQRPNAVES
jgi:hypothetical protein